MKGGFEGSLIQRIRIEIISFKIIATCQLNVVR